MITSPAPSPNSDGKPGQPDQRLQTPRAEKPLGKQKAQRPFRVGTKVELMCCWAGPVQQWMPGRVVQVGEADVLVHWTDFSGRSHDDIFAADDSRIRRRRVTFKQDSAQVYAVPAHCEYYGVHPSFFSFDSQGSKVANMAAITRGALEWASVKRKCTAERLFRFITHEEAIQLLQEGVPSPSADEEEEVLQPVFNAFPQRPIDGPCPSQTSGGIPRPSECNVPQKDAPRIQQQATNPGLPFQAAPGLAGMVPTPLRSLVYPRAARLH